MTTSTIFAIIFCIILCLIAWKCCFSPYINKLNKDTSGNICYLCLEKIPDEFWMDGSHRRDCAIRNAPELYSMPKSDVECPKCKQKLREWPLKGEKFYCEDPKCPTQGAITNTGRNRFNCFLCDYTHNICLRCVSRKQIGPAAIALVVIHPKPPAITSIEPDDNLPGITCYLCLKKIPNEHWMDGSHRRNCAIRNAPQINSIAKSHFDCAKCKQKLRKWPSRGEKFYCDEPRCPVQGAITNRGQNRYNCFPCDYDICLDCVFRKEIRPDDIYTPHVIHPKPPTITSDEPVKNALVPSYDRARINARPSVA